jgi:prepilin-type N-terminal cleavage/methylation domain-containing protein
MKRDQKGFTLIELLVVVIIIGVLALAGFKGYLGSSEAQKAETGSDLVSQVAHANLLYYADHTNYVSGAITNALCSGQTGCPNGNGACSLITCGYLKMRNFDTQPFMVWAGDGNTTCGDAAATGMGLNPSGVVACGRRRKSTDGAGGTPNATYGGWGYAMTKNGIVTKVGTGVPGFSQ